MTVTALEPALRDIGEALGLPINASQIDTLLRYLMLLQRWNSTYNLTSVRVPAEMLTQHLADCLAIITPLIRQAGPGPLELLDVGSGGGLPGIVIATMLPSVKVTCVDAVGKKAAFVRQAAGELKLGNLKAEHTRVERLSPSPRFDVIVSRAFSALPEFVRLTMGSIAVGGCWLAMKGKHPTDEIAQLPPSVSVFHVEQLLVPSLMAERCLVWMRVNDAPNL